jgi:hypothetical protein
VIVTSFDQQYCDAFQEHAGSQFPRGRKNLEFELKMAAVEAIIG